MQTANCFELAILLVSFLIGCGYNAFIVYGYATEIISNNDLRQIKIDLPKESNVYILQYLFEIKCLPTSLILMIEG